MINKLKFDENYDSFENFFNDNKEIIYKSVIKIFQEFLTTNEKKTLYLSVNAKISNLDWDTEFVYTKGQKTTLYRDILPYFESIEDYETCIEIRELIKNLN
jgi:hypothetical protein